MSPPSGRPVFEILLAEDNRADVQLVREALDLHRVTCNLQVVSDGEQALRHLAVLEEDPGSHPLDLLLLDLYLPKHDGIEILEWLRASTRHAQLPVIVMTGSDSRHVEEKTVKYGTVQYFQKASNLEEFMHLGVVVADLLGREADHRKRPPQGSVSQ